MQEKKSSSFIFIIVAAIVGSTLFKQIDFKNMRVEKPWLALIYFIVLAFSIYFLINNNKKKE